MIWPFVANKLKAVFEAKSGDPGGPPHKFDVEFTGAWAKQIGECLKTQDEIQLALKGAKRELSGSRPSTLKMKLQYTEGALVKLVRRRGDLQPIDEIIDTWKRERNYLVSCRITNLLPLAKSPPPPEVPDVPKSTDWFSTPCHQVSREPTPPNPSFVSVQTSTPAATSSVTNRVVESLPQPTPRADTKTKQQPLPSTNADPFTDQKKPPRSNLPHPALQAEPPVPKLTKKQQRRQKALEKAKARVSLAQSTDGVNIDPKLASSHAQNIARIDAVLPAPSIESTMTNTANSLTPSHTAESPKAKPSGILALKAGLITSNGVSPCI